MHSARMSILAGTALALILTITTTAQTAPQASSGISPVTRDYSTPGSMPKPSTAIMPADDGMRFRDTLPSMGNTTPLAPAAPAMKAEPPAAPAAKVEPPVAPVAPAAAAKPVPQAQPVTAEETDAKFEAAPAAPAPVRPVARPAAAPEPAPRPVATPEPATRPAAARPAPVAAKPAP